MATIIGQCAMREELYRGRYENAKVSTTEFSYLHVGYRDALKQLYIKILRFQATCVCFLSNHTLERAMKDTVKWNDWDKLLTEILDQETVLKSIETQWRDVKVDEESRLQTTRYGEACKREVMLHEQRIESLRVIETEVSRLRDVVTSAQNHDERKELLRWLSSVDSSTNYNTARKTHAKTTGDWLLERSREFDAWKTDPSSLLWLHGQGPSFHRWSKSVQELRF